jgi:hypothetical protein
LRSPDATNFTALIDGIAEYSAVARRLASHFWPGPLTLVLPRRPNVPAEVTRTFFAGQAEPDQTLRDNRQQLHRVENDSVCAGIGLIHIEQPERQNTCVLVEPDHTRRIWQRRAEADEDEHHHGGAERDGEVEGADHDVAREDRQEPQRDGSDEDGEQESVVGNTCMPATIALMMRFTGQRIARQPMQHPAIDECLAAPIEQQRARGG